MNQTQQCKHPQLTPVTADEAEYMQAEWALSAGSEVSTTKEACAGHWHVIAEFRDTGGGPILTAPTPVSAGSC